jgi:transcriptional regulator with GAF, ATPase, and Fis domain
MQLLPLAAAAFPGGALTAERFEVRLAFERFVAELSGRFINAPADRYEDGIREALGQVCTHLALDRCSLFLMGPDGSAIDTVSVTPPGAGTVLPPPEAVLTPSLIERLRAGSPVSTPGANGSGEYDVLLLPLQVDGSIAAVLGVDAPRTDQAPPLEARGELTAIAGVFSRILERQQREERLQGAADEAQRLKDRIELENAQLRKAIQERVGITRLVGESPAFRRAMEQAEEASAHDAPVLLVGESGTGKTLLAAHMHELGARRSRAMVRVNCAAIPATLIETDLFGRERGAFTGALTRQVGRFQLADRSTIFLSEIGDLSLEMQAKLLRALDERRIERLGSRQPIPIDTRIIAATRRDLQLGVSDGTFLADLYERLHAHPIHVPPLRERIDDIPRLVWRFVEEFSTSFGKCIDAIDRGNLASLREYAWPGNVRELRNTVERAMIAATGRRLNIPVPQSSVPARRGPKLIDVEKDHIRAVLESTSWRIRGQGGAADRLGLKPTTLETRMAKLGLRRPRH